MKDIRKTKPKVLIVEDNTINQMLIMHILESAGYRCVLATNGQMALDLFEKDVFQLILMDIQMPVMDGYTAVKKIREKEAGKGTRSLIIGLTAYAMKGDKEKVLAAGMDYYMAKPFRDEELLYVIHQLEGNAEDYPNNKNAPIKFELTHFLSKFNNDIPFIRNLYQNFVIITDDLLEKINMGISEQNAQSVTIAAHSLKGSLALMEAGLAEILANKIESYAKDDKFVDSRLSFAKLNREINKIKDQIEAYLSTPQQ